MLQYLNEKPKIGLNKKYKRRRFAMSGHSKWHNNKTSILRATRTLLLK